MANCTEIIANFCQLRSQIVQQFLPIIANLCQLCYFGNLGRGLAKSLAPLVLSHIYLKIQFYVIMHQLKSNYRQLGVVHILRKPLFDHFRPPPSPP